jgi:cysteine dioxygenase
MLKLDNIKYNLNDLLELAKKDYEVEKLAEFKENQYNRIILYKNDNIEVALVCFKIGQTTNIHDHQGSDCVVKVISGNLLETLFDKNDFFTVKSNKVLNKNDISGIDGCSYHSVTALEQSILLNFYSPGFTHE